MRKLILVACSLSLLVSAGCTCDLNDWLTLDYDPFDKRTFAEKEADEAEEAEWEDHNAEIKERLRRPSAIYP